MINGKQKFMISVQDCVCVVGSKTMTDYTQATETLVFDSNACALLIIVFFLPWLQL